MGEHSYKENALELEKKTLYKNIWDIYPWLIDWTLRLSSDQLRQQNLNCDLSMIWSDLILERQEAAPTTPAINAKMTMKPVAAFPIGKYTAQKGLDNEIHVKRYIIFI